jgi:hypothetical protein
MRPYTKKVLLGILISLAVLSGMIVPWTIRNYVCFNRFVLLNTNAGYAFFWGNHPIHGRNFVSILPAEGPSYQDLIPPTWQRLDEAALEKKLLSQGLKFIIDEPIRFGFLCFGRALEYFKFWPSKESSLISNLARVFSFGIFFPFMILGIWRDYSRNSQPHPWRYIQSPGFVLLLFSICHSAVYFLSWGLIRYRLPVDAVLIVFAGSGIFLTLEKLHTHWSLRSIRD